MAARLGIDSVPTGRFWRLKAREAMGRTLQDDEKEFLASYGDTVPDDLPKERQTKRETSHEMSPEEKQDLANKHAETFRRRMERQEHVDTRWLEDPFTNLFRSIGGLFRFGHRRDDDGSSGVPARRRPSGPRSPARFVNAETYEDDPEAFQGGDQGEKLTAEDIMKRRRMERIERARVGRPFHERVMLFFLKGWLLIGPVAFVALTAAEVAYILTHLVAHDDQNGEIIIWGGALFIEFAMMFTTFGLGIKRHEASEYREIYGKRDPALEGLVAIGTILWIVFAIINIVGQSSFLMSLVQSSHDPNMQVLYLFVASRVVGFILGDAGTAFFLGQVDSNDVRLMARAEHEKGKLYMELAEAEGKRKLLEAEADSKVKSMAIKVEQERADAEFLAELKRQTFTRILEVQGGPQMALPSPSADLPITGEFQTLNAEGQTSEQERVRIRRLDK